MATRDPGTDQESLSPGQQDALQQYIQVTQQEIKDAIPLLQRSEWNVQVGFLFG
jgi:FAS-associated factor 2